MPPAATGGGEKKVILMMTGSIPLKVDASTDDAAHTRLRLMAVICEASGGVSWDTARGQWSVTARGIDPTSSATCVCGHVGLKTLYQIRNVVTGEVVYPIGSSCINLFGDKSLGEGVKVLSAMVDLQLIAAERDFDFKADFTRWGIRALHLYGVVDGPECRFLLKMFNRRTEPSGMQREWDAKFLQRVRQTLITQQSAGAA